ncbi:hypothetical protein WH52_12845 [Tenacibaculum holothuriorum]|uniref:TonB C-terminal domain-containing protein n=1 Tax=Tenacibaculum holothuriorum TaxID=1635173 RepID=A0A1Y2PBI0_9FLAO|nr:energy transducer TonB [Tenacibaculum holothuriorum]OSY87147.1 hypothetical protein WH52_12845 [Tenacibaculum holothuriorum]
MKQQKKSPRKQLEKFSNIFMQLGLVITLFIVLITLEHKSEVVAIKITDISKANETIYNLDDKPKIFIKEVEKRTKPKPKKRKPVSNFSEIDKRDDDKETVETVIDKDDEDVIDIDVIDEIPEGDIIEDDDEPKLFVNLQNVPVFKGCENLSEDATKQCFEKKMMKHVQRNFNSDLAQEIGLRSGKHRIFTQFVIDKKGEVVNIKVSATSPKLKKEAERVVNKIPKFTPGKQNNKPVKVKYTLPITFMVN